MINPNSPWRKGNHFLFRGRKKTIYINSRECILVNGKHVYVARVVVESVIGRKLLSSEHVHHKDGDLMNNEASNLFICKNGMGEHNTIHWKNGTHVWHTIPWRNGKPKSKPAD